MMIAACAVLAFLAASCGSSHDGADGNTVEPEAVAGESANAAYARKYDSAG